MSSIKEILNETELKANAIKYLINMFPNITYDKFLGEYRFIASGIYANNCSIIHYEDGFKEMHVALNFSAYKDLQINYGNVHSKFMDYNLPTNYSSKKIFPLVFTGFYMPIDCLEDIDINIFSKNIEDWCFINSKNYRDDGCNLSNAINCRKKILSSIRDVLE
jgi:hypothetical protein